METMAHKTCKAFDYVAYDNDASEKQAEFKKMCIDMHVNIEQALPNGRAISLAFTKLEEVYMWIGKAIRDEQLLRNANTQLQEQRANN